MKHKPIIVLAALLFICTPSWGQKRRSAKQVAKAEQMPYARTTKYWGPGTFYCYAPGKPINKMADNSISHMRDLTGISRDDFFTEMIKQSFSKIPYTKKKTWYKPSKHKELHYFSSADKSYILEPDFEDLYMSPVKDNGEYEYAVKNVVRYELIPADESQKVIDAIFKFMGDLRELKVTLGTFGSNFKKADPKAYPIERVMSGGWTGICAGTWLLRSVDGKLQGIWGNNEEILGRTISKPDFHFVTDAYEPDFYYNLMVDLTKYGYVLRYQVSAVTLTNLPPGNTWEKEYPKMLQIYKNAVQAEKNTINLYKKAPFPPVIHDLKKIIHLK